MTPKLIIKDNRAIINTNALLFIIKNFKIETYGNVNGVLYAYPFSMIDENKSYSKLHDREIKYVRYFDHDEIFVRNWSLLNSPNANEWYKSAMTFDALCRTTSRHSYYTYNEIMEQFMHFARTLYVDGLIILVKDLERKLVKGEKLTDQEILDLVTNIEENIVELKRDYEYEQRRASSLESTNMEQSGALDDIVKYIDNKFDKCIDKDILKDIRNKISKLY